MTVFVIAPDKPSGDAFNAALKEHGIKTEIQYADIESRVVADRISTNPKVQHDLADAIAQGHRRGFSTMVIACNTLQLWVDRAMSLLPSGVANHVQVLTTFDALRRQFPDQRHRPLWLGTTPTVKAIEDFPTLLSLGSQEVQDVVQRIIWRTKAVTGADTRTAPVDIEDIRSPEKLREDVSWVIKELKRFNVRRAILGCTELPIAFREYVRERRIRSVKRSDLSLVFIDPAVSVAKVLSARKVRRVL